MPEEKSDWCWWKAARRKSQSPPPKKKKIPRGKILGGVLAGEHSKLKMTAKKKSERKTKSQALAGQRKAQSRVHQETPEEADA